MKEFIARYGGWIVGAIVVMWFAWRAGRLLKKAKQIDREGIETEGVISRIEEVRDPDTASDTCTTYVQFRDDRGQIRESPATLTDSAEYTVGEKVRIRFLPGDYEIVRIIG